MKRKLEILKQDRKDIDRESKLKKIQDLQEVEKALDEKLASCKTNDPVEIEKIVKQTAKNKLNVNRWTDNIWIIKKYLTKKKGMSGKEVDKILKIDSNFDYI